MCGCIGYTGQRKGASKNGNLNQQLLPVQAQRKSNTHARTHACMYARTHTPHTHTHATTEYTSQQTPIHLMLHQPLHMQESPYHTTCEPRAARQTNNNTTRQLLRSTMTSRSTRKHIYRHVSNMCLKLDNAASGACKWRTQGMTKRTKHTQTMPRKGSMHPAMGSSARPTGDSSCR